MQLSARLRGKIAKAEAFMAEVKAVPFMRPLPVEGQRGADWRVFDDRPEAEAAKKAAPRQDIYWMNAVQRMEGGIHGIGATMEALRFKGEAVDILAWLTERMLEEGAKLEDISPALTDFQFEIILNLIRIFTDNHLNDEQERYMAERWLVYKLGYGLVGGIWEDGRLNLLVYKAAGVAEAAQAEPVPQ